MQRNEPVGIHQPERNLEENIIVPETQVEQPITTPNERINSQNVERSEGNDIFLFHDPRFDQCEHKQQQSMKHPNFINLANIELTDIQKTVLFKGLKFAPTPKRNTF